MVTPAPIQDAWSTEKTVIWDNATPYYIISVATDFFDDKNLPIYPLLDYLEVCINRTCYYQVQ